MTPLGTRPGARTDRRAAIERDVLDATEALLAAGASFGELSVERIATRGGISRTAFYFYFRDKRELLMRLTEDVSEQLYAEAERWWGGEGDGARALEAALRKILAIYAQHGAGLRAVVEAAANDEQVAQFWRALLGRFADATRARIEAEHGPEPAAEIAFALVWMTERACYQRLAVGQSPTDPAFAEGLVGVWVRGIYGG